MLFAVVLVVSGEVSLVSPELVTKPTIEAVQELMQPPPTEHESSGALSAAAFITLGKFCIASAELTKRLLVRVSSASMRVTSG